jgi:hypothetical protein
MVDAVDFGRDEHGAEPGFHWRGNPDVRMREERVHNVHQLVKHSCDGRHSEQPDDRDKGKDG